MDTGAAGVMTRRRPGAACGDLLHRAAAPDRPGRSRTMSNEIPNGFILCNGPAPPDMSTSLLDPDWIRRFRETSQMALVEARRYRDDLCLSDFIRSESRQCLADSLNRLVGIINEALSNPEKRDSAV